MTNSAMWILIKERTENFYKRIFKPLGLCKKGDLKVVEAGLKCVFFKKRNHSGWANSFLRMIDDAETEIVLHKREPKQFVDELEDINTYIKIWSGF